MVTKYHYTDRREPLTCSNTARSKGLQPCRACCFQPDSFPTLEWLCLIGAEQRSSYPQAQQSSGNMQSSGISSQASCVRTVTGHSPAKGNHPGLSILWLRDYDVGCWYEAWSIPVQWHVQNGNCESFNLRWYRSGGSPGKSINEIILQYELS